MAAAPATMTAAPGGTASTKITTTALNGFASVVALSAGSLPAGITVQFSPAGISGGGTSTMTAQAASTTPAGVYPITVTGTGGGVSPSPAVVVMLTVSGFTLTAGSSTATVANDGSTVIALGTTTTSGFAGALTLSAGNLGGVTPQFLPAIITNPAAGVSYLRLTSTAAALKGTRTITITATSPNGAVRTVAVQLTVH